MWTIQFMDYEEGSSRMWRDLSNSGPGRLGDRITFDSKEAARNHIRRLRETYTDDPYDEMIAYRVVEVGSDKYYSQPTDILEY